MKTSAITRQLRISTLAIASALLLVGCGSESTTLAPQTGELPGSPVMLPASELAALAPLGTSGAAPSAEATISATKGGTLRLGRMTLDFPPGALTQDTRISMTLVERTTLRVELEPHGIRFQQPVTLSARLDGLLSATTRSVGVAWWNDASGRWEEISRSTSNSRQASAELWHFSRYDVFSE